VQRVWNGAQEMGPDSVESRLLKTVQEVAAELHPRQSRIRTPTLDSTLDRDLGVDSLGRVELLSRIERSFEVSLPEEVFMAAETPRDLLRALLTASNRSTVSAPAPVEETSLAQAGATPRSARTLVEVLAWHLRAHPDRPHLRLYSDAGGDGEMLTYRALHTHAVDVASGLQERGLQPRQAVAIMLPTGLEFFISFLGVLLAGGVPVPIYPPVRPSQLEEHLRRQRAILSNCQAIMLITVPEAKPLARLLHTQVDTLQAIVTAKELSLAARAYALPMLRAEDIALLQYTSGSTGAPKGVILTHANLLANIRAVGEAIDVRYEDIFVSWLPLYHDMGLIGAWLGSLYHAVMLVIMSPLAFLGRPQRWLWAIHRYRGTLSAAPNFAYELCLRRISRQELEGLDLSSWRIAFNGAEAVSPNTVQRFGERFAPYGLRPESIYPVYGLAECSVGLTFPSLGQGPRIDRIQRDAFMHSGLARPAEGQDPHPLRFVACGRPLPGHELRIVDPTGRELPERMEGRLQFRGPSATSGYYQNMDATRRLFDKDWLDSGDRAYVAAGEVYITGRSKDIIIRGGRNIYPHEVEEAVGKVDGIRKGCVVVFGSPDPITGTERLIVVAETREQAPMGVETLRAKINTITTDLTEVPPDEIVLTPPHAVLKTSSGKVRRAATRELFERGELGRRPKAVWWQVAHMTIAALAPQLRRATRVSTSFIYAGYAWVVLIVLAISVWPMVVLQPRIAWRFAVIRAASRWLIRAWGVRCAVQGLEQLPAQDEPCVLVASHGSYIDGAILTSVLPVDFSFVAKAELARQFVAGNFLRSLGTQFVERFDAAKGYEDAKRIAAAAARSRHPLMYFPEGRLTRISGVLPFRMGAFLVAAATGIPVVPIALRGTRSILRPGSWFFRRGAVTVTIGKPIVAIADPPANGGDPWDIALRLRDEARAHILRHCGEPELTHEDVPL
jgi:1-acyl-sn-glycerol-3-phosphate acyltransferase